MRTRTYALFALVIAAVMVSTGAAWSVMSTDLSRALNGSDDHDQDGSHGHNDTDNETGDHDLELNQTTRFLLDRAGGGGWFMANNASNVSSKDTFGFELDGTTGHFNNSSMVFQARNVGMTVHMRLWNTIAFDNVTVPGAHTAHATGMAVGGGKNWSFRLQLSDVGKGMDDKFLLVLTNGTMTLTFQSTGLGGGNIEVEPLIDTDAMEASGEQV